LLQFFDKHLSPENNSVRPVPKNWGI